MDIQRILNKARKSISSYCFEECRAYCCRKGYLVLTKKELDVITDRRSDSYKELIQALKDGRFSLYMGLSDSPCPALLPDFKCRVHKSRNRPSACRDFPIFYNDDTVCFSNRCLAVKSGQFYPYIARLKSLGLRVIFSDSILESFNNKNDFTNSGPKDTAAATS